MSKFIVVMLLALVFMPLWAEDVPDIQELTRKAEQGDAEAQFNLGECHRKGEGVEQNLKQAVNWYQKAAKQGNAKAQCHLGICYYIGTVVVLNYKQAVYWLQKAAEQGIVEAQVILGTCYGLGKGVVQNYQEAYFWYLLAAANGNEVAQEGINVLDKELSLQQINDTQARATKWFNEHNNE